MLGQRLFPERLHLPHSYGVSSPTPPLMPLALPDAAFSAGPAATLALRLWRISSFPDAAFAKGGSTAGPASANVTKTRILPHC